MGAEHGGDFHANVAAANNDNFLVLALGIGNSLVQSIAISNVAEVINAVELGILGSEGVQSDCSAS